MRCFTFHSILSFIHSFIHSFLSSSSSSPSTADQQSHPSSTPKPSYTNGGTTPTPPPISASSPRSAAERRSEFAIRPGYSSGASSYEGSVGDDDDFDKDLRVSRHSDILALSDLRQEMVAEGDLTKTVVRIEVSVVERNIHDGCLNAPGFVSLNNFLSV